MTDKTRLYVLSAVLYSLVAGAWLFWNMRGNPFLSRNDTRFAEAKTYFVESVASLPAAIGLILER